MNPKTSHTPKPEYIIGQLTEPSCGDADCDIHENPEHWVSIELCEPYKSAPELLEAIKAAISALSQNAVFPADIEATKTWLKAAVVKAEVRL